MSAWPASRHGLLTIVVVALAASGCAMTSSAVESDGGAAKTAVPVVAMPGAPSLPVAVDSADGRRVTVTDVSRIVVLQGNVAEVVYALGLGDRVVGRDISTTIAEADDVPIVTRAHDVSAESVLSLRPTLVLADTTTGPPEALEHLRSVGVPVVVFPAATRVDEIGPRIESIAEALGVTEAGRRMAAETVDAIGAVTAGRNEGDGPRVAFLYLRGQAGVYLLGGPGSGADSMIASAGGLDAGTAIALDRPFTPITSEALVTAAPDVILMTTTGLESVGGVDGLLAVPGVAQTPAGQARHVVTIEDGLLYSFGVRTPEALRNLADDIGASKGASPS